MKRKQPEVKLERYLDALEVAQMLKISRTYVYMLAKAGRIRHVTWEGSENPKRAFNSLIRFPESAVAEFLAKHTVEAVQ